MMASKSFVFRFDDVEVREREFTLIKAGKVLTVEPKAFRALLFLLHNPQRLISKEELLNTVWDDAAVTEGSLTRCTSRCCVAGWEMTSASRATSPPWLPSDIGSCARSRFPRTIRETRKRLASQLVSGEMMTSKCTPTEASRKPPILKR
jgi:Transcriptional regulatory protein, C terminal